MKKLNAERLKTVRKSLGITPAEASRMTGLDKSTYHKYENGSAAPSDPTLRILAMYLGTSIEYLIGQTDDPAPTVLPVPVDHETASFVADYARLDDDQRRVIKEMIQLLRNK